MAGKVSDEDMFKLEKRMKKSEAIIACMTEEERTTPDLLARQVLRILLYFLHENRLIFVVLSGRFRTFETDFGVYPQNQRLPLIFLILPWKMWVNSSRRRCMYIWSSLSRSPSLSLAMHSQSPIISCSPLFPLVLSYSLLFSFIPSHSLLSSLIPPIPTPLSLCVRAARKSWWGRPS